MSERRRPIAHSVSSYNISRRLKHTDLALRENNYQLLEQGGKAGTAWSTWRASEHLAPDSQMRMTE